MEEAILCEYKALREEIITDSTRRASVQNLGTALFMGVQAVAFMQKVPELSVAATMLILAFYHDDIRWLEGMVKIGAYIRHVIEPQVAGLQWETIIDRIGDPVRQTPRFWARMAMLSSRYPMTAMVAIGLNVAAAHHAGLGMSPRLGIDLSLIGLALVWTVRLLVIDTDYGAMHHRWNQVFSKLAMSMGERHVDNPELAESGQER